MGFSAASYIVAQCYTSAADMSWTSIINGSHYRAVNGLYVFLMFSGWRTGVCYAIVQALLDRDLLATFSFVVPPFQGLYTQLQIATLYAILQAIGFTILNLITYHMFARRRIVSVVLMIARRIYRLPKADRQALKTPNFLTMGMQSFGMSLLICILWEFSTTLFVVYLSHVPIIRGKPLSSDSSNPDGTLISGLLLSRKPLTQLLSLEELRYIAYHVPSRRRAIFENVDSNPTVFQQICNACKSVIDNALVEVKIPTDHAITTPILSNTSKSTIGGGSLFTPPKATIITEQDAFRKTPPSTLSRVFKAVSTFGTPKTPNSHPSKGSKDTSSSNVKESPIVDAQKKIMQAASTEFVLLKSHSPFGPVPSYSSFSVMPMSDGSGIAALALSRLVVHSLAEDTLGTVQRDVVGIIRYFFTVLSKLQKYMEYQKKNALENRGLFPLPKNDRAEYLERCVTEALVEIIEGFAPYLSNMGCPPDLVSRCKKFSDDHGLVHIA